MTCAYLKPGFFNDQIDKQFFDAFAQNFKTKSKLKKYKGANIICHKNLSASFYKRSKINEVEIDIANNQDNFFYRDDRGNRIRKPLIPYNPPIRTRLLFSYQATPPSRNLLIDFRKFTFYLTNRNRLDNENISKALQLSSKLKEKEFNGKIDLDLKELNKKTPQQILEALFYHLRDIPDEVKDPFAYAEVVLAQALEVAKHIEKRGAVPLWLDASKFRDYTPPNTDN